MKRVLWAAMVAGLAVSGCGLSETDNSWQSYVNEPNYKIAKNAARCVYFFEMVRVGSQYSYENHEYLAPHMITPEYLSIMQSTYPEQYMLQLESHKKGMNDRSYSDLFKEISEYYLVGLGLTQDSAIKYIADVAPADNEDIFRVIRTFQGGSLNFDEYKNLYRDINNIGSKIDCGISPSGTYGEFLRTSNSKLLAQVRQGLRAKQNPMPEQTEEVQADTESVDSAESAAEAAAAAAEAAAKAAEGL